MIRVFTKHVMLFRILALLLLTLLKSNICASSVNKYQRVRIVGQERISLLVFFITRRLHEAASCFYLFFFAPQVACTNKHTGRIIRQSTQPPARQPEFNYFLSLWVTLHSHKVQVERWFCFCSRRERSPRTTTHQLGLFNGFYEGRAELVLCQPPC